MEIDDKTGLVLEGGGMRGVFTCGVLDCFMDRGVKFPYVVGVSAGACNGLSYMSGQRGRAKFSNIDMMERYRYIGLRYLWTQRSILDLKLLYEDLPERLYPYDYSAYRRNSTRYEMVTTDCFTGQACYLHEPESEERIMAIVKASSSLPYVCPMVQVDGTPMLDGGIVDSIPVLRAQNLGYEKNVVVLTRNRGYRKSGGGDLLPRFVYRRYPRLREALSRRSEVYNAQLALVEQLEAEGRVLVIRPRRPLEVGRMGTDVGKLTALYKEGYEEAVRVLDAGSEIRI